MGFLPSTVACHSDFSHLGSTPCQQAVGSGDKNLTNGKRMMVQDETLDIAPIDFETLNFTCEVIPGGVER